MDTQCDFGPSVREHMKAMPLIYRIFIPIVGACLLVIIAILLGQIIDVYRLGVRKRKAYKSVRIPSLHFNTIMILSVPVVIVFLKLLELLFPRQHLVVVFLCASFEARAFASVLDLINIYLDGPEEALSALMNKSIRQQDDARCGLCKSVILRLCCLKKITAFGMLRIRIMVYQFVVIYPLIHLIILMMPPEDAVRLAPLQFVSAVLCVQALLFMTWSSEDLLLDLSIHSKFWAVKFTLLANAVLMSVVQLIHNRNPDIDWYVSSVEYREQAPGVWAALLTSLIMLPLSVLIRKAFSPTEFALIPVTRCMWTPLESELQRKDMPTEGTLNSQQKEGQNRRVDWYLASEEGPLVGT